MAQVNIHALSEEELLALKRKNVIKIWSVAGILALVTAVEFLMAFTMPRGMLLNILFILLTLVKAFYIVADFMHLKHEAKGLVYSVVGPMAFIAWLIGALLYEADHILDALNNWFIY